MAEAALSIDRRSLADQVYDHVKHLILSGQIQGGERVPEEGIARDCGVSRTPIREALRRLEQYGLIRLKPRSYAEVVTLTAAEADDVAGVRGALEGLAVRQLAARATSEDLAVLRQRQADCKAGLATRDLAAVFERDSLFHAEIAKRCGNACLRDHLERLDAKVQLCRLVRCLTREHVKAAVAQHEVLLDALARHDGEAAAALMARHAALPPATSAPAKGERS